MFVTRLAGYSKSLREPKNALYRVGYWIDIDENEWSDAPIKNGDKYYPYPIERVSADGGYISRYRPGEIIEMENCAVYGAEEAANLVNYLNGGSSAQ